MNKEEKEGMIAVEEQTDAQGAVHVVCDEQVEKLIRNSVYGAMGCGIVPIHWFQLASVAGVQINLVRQLSALYGVDFKEEIVKKIITSVVSAGASTLAAPLLRAAVASIPLVGLPLAVGAQPVMNGFATYAVGRMFVTQFERGGSFVKANMDEMKRDFNEAYKHSREWLGNVVGGKKENVADAQDAVTAS